MNINTLKQALPYLFKANITPLVIGTHGCGKTSGFQQFCSENGYEFLSFRLGQLADAGDMTGLPHLDTENDVTKFLKPEWWPTSGKGVIFLDEINRARRELLQCVFELCEKGTMNGRTLPEGWHVAAAMNPDTEDYTTTDVSDKAFLDRFCHIKITSSYQDFLNYGQEKEFNKTVLSFISSHPGMLRGNNKDFTLDSVEPSDRSWEKVAKLNDMKDIPENILNEFVTGLVGVAASVAFMAHKLTNEKPVDGMLVLKDYSKAQKAIKEQSDEKNYRPDLLNDTMQQIITYLKEEKRDESFSKEEYGNLVAFLLDLPADLFIGGNKQLFKIGWLFKKICEDPQIEEVSKKQYEERKKLQEVKKDEVANEEEVK